MTGRHRPQCIELFTAPGCAACDKTLAELRATIGELAPDAELIVVDVVQHIDRAVELGIRQVPAVAIDGRVTSRGELREVLGEER